MEHSDKIITTLTVASNLMILQSNFQFKKIFYRQNKGLPIGSPILGILSKIKLRLLEKEIMGKTKDKIQLYTRYVDDVFFIIDNKTNSSAQLDKLNEINSKIKFTMTIKIKCHIWMSY